MAASKGFGGRMPAGKGAPARKSRWGGIPSAAPRVPIIEASKEPQRVRILGCEITFNKGSGHESFKCDAEVVASDVHEPGTRVLVGPFIVNGKSKDVGEGRVKALAVAAMGLSTDEEFDTLFPDGDPIDNALNGLEGEDSFLGHEVDVIVSRGGAMDSGDYYREYEWSPVQ